MEVDEVFRAFAISQGERGTMIACLYTGVEFPPYCAPMPREPLPQTGMRLDKKFHVHVSAAIALNPSVHDGAIMVGRRAADEEYEITGWSFRLFAPDLGQLPPVNRGSAFNSCFALAEADDVDRVYLHSAGQMHMFVKGVHQVIYEPYAE